jgi:glycogen operon protein
MRQFWIPRGSTPDQGTYVEFPLETLLERVEQASRRHRCAVIGEDLGNVPDGLRARLSEARMLGYRVAYFERDRAGRFLPPDAYAPGTAASISTHDLPTARGFLHSLDIDERVQRGLYVSTEQAAAARAERARALTALQTALEPFGHQQSDMGFTLALHRFLAASASRLAIVQLEDVLEMKRQVNLPGLGDEAPNWRQRLPVEVERLADDPRMRAMAGIFAERSRSS